LVVVVTVTVLVGMKFSKVGDAGERGSIDVALAPLPEGFQTLRGEPLVSFPPSQCNQSPWEMALYALDTALDTATYLGEGMMCVSRE
jgi:hypothetical protein